MDRYVRFARDFGAVEVYRCFGDGKFEGGQRREGGREGGGGGENFYEGG